MKMKFVVLCFTAFGIVGPVTAWAQFEREVPQYTPTADGVINAQEMAGQLAIPMAWPMETCALPLSGSGTSEENLIQRYSIANEQTKVELRDHK